jgi:L-arabinose isomerase
VAPQLNHKNPPTKPRTAKVGIFVVGHYTYWPQFPGLLDEMHHKLGVLARKVEAFGVEVTSFGMVDSALGPAELLPMNGSPLANQ